MIQDEKYSVQFEMKDGKPVLIVSEKREVPFDNGILRQTVDQGGQGGWSGWAVIDGKIHFVNKMYNGDLLYDRIKTPEQLEQEVLYHLHQAGSVVFPLPVGTY
jgi:hypothetical protein